MTSCAAIAPATESAAGPPASLWSPWSGTPTPARAPCSTPSARPASPPRTSSSPTLDPVTRRIRLPGGRPVLLTDTVGFIQKLSHDLVAAFRATLEELQEASVILHVVDINPSQRRRAGRSRRRDPAGAWPSMPTRGFSCSTRPTSSNRRPTGASTPLRSPGRGRGDVPTVVISAERRWALDDLLRIVEAEVGKAAPKVASLWSRPLAVASLPSLVLGGKARKGVRSAPRRSQRRLFRIPSGVQGAKPPPGVQRVPLFPKDVGGRCGRDNGIRRSQTLR